MSGAPLSTGQVPNGPRNNDRNGTQEGSGKAQDTEPSSLGNVPHRPENEGNHHHSEVIAEGGVRQIAKYGNKGIHWRELVVIDWVCLCISLIPMDVKFLISFFVSISFTILMSSVLLLWDRARIHWQAPWPGVFLHTFFLEKTPFTPLGQSRLLVMLIGLAFALTPREGATAIDGAALMALLAGYLCGHNLVSVWLKERLRGKGGAS